MTTTATERETLITSGRADVYRLYDVGYAIDLDAAAQLLPPGRSARLSMGAQASTLHIPVLPLRVQLDRVALTGPLAGLYADVSARCYDFGTIAVRLCLDPHDGPVPWDTFSAFARDVGQMLRSGDLFAPVIASLTEALAPAITRPHVAAVSEDYTVYRLDGVWDGAGQLLPAAALDDERLTELLLQEERPLSESARHELLPHRFSYYQDDLVVLSWEQALVLSPDAGDEADVEWVLEFANAQLLELRFYDAQLDAELPRLYDDVARARRGQRPLLTPRYARVLGRLYELFADITETVERVDNALRVTGDVYLARVYAAAMETFRGRAWRAGIDRKLEIISDTYEMLNAEAQARRSELLEATIVALIVIEIGMVWLV
ncbi:MAG: hypothetical protein KGL93_11890 [Gemmatimonadota bacterium]|nr:hypothetical protein [Gemmatimonadota bacterium]